MGTPGPKRQLEALIQEVMSHLAVGRFHSFPWLVQTSFLEEASVEMVLMIYKSIGPRNYLLLLFSWTCQNWSLLFVTGNFGFSAFLVVPIDV